MAEAKPHPEQLEGLDEQQEEEPGNRQRGQDINRAAHRWRQPRIEIVDLDILVAIQQHQ